MGSGILILWGLFAYMVFKFGFVFHIILSLSQAKSLSRFCSSSSLPSPTGGAVSEWLCMVLGG